MQKQTRNCPSVVRRRPALYPVECRGVNISSNRKKRLGLLIEAIHRAQTNENIEKYNLDAYLFSVNSANFTSECFCFTITEYCFCALLTVTILSSLRLNCFMFLFFPYWTNDTRLVACGLYGLSEACTITACDWLPRKMSTQQWCQPVYVSVLCMVS